MSQNIHELKLSEEYKVQSFAFLFILKLLTTLIVYSSEKDLFTRYEQIIIPSLGKGEAALKNNLLSCLFLIVRSLRNTLWNKNIKKLRS